MSEITFNHKMAAHCESGSVTALLNHAGLEISEPMVFGISSGIFFGYLKGPRFAFPVFIVRSKPGQIRKNISKRLGVKYHTASFKNPQKGEDELDRLLEQNIPVAVQVDFYYMNYILSHERVHINAHFINIVGKKGTKYIVSDSYFPKLVEFDRESLMKGRFAEGSMAPKGFMFYPTYVPENIDYEKAIRTGIKKASYYMLKLPIPFLGIKGIRKFADSVVEWPKYARDIEHLSHEIMKINVLLEDQGTGGAGFRFIYATFLREASEMIGHSGLLEMSKRMMEIGDGWREISLFTAKIGKNRDLGQDRLKELGNIIRKRADVEEVFFRDLQNIIK